MRRLASISSGRNLRGLGKPTLSLEQVRRIQSLCIAASDLSHLVYSKTKSHWPVARNSESDEQCVIKTQTGHQQFRPDREAEIPMQGTKTEMRDFAREEFERFRHVDDLVSLDLNAVKGLPLLMLW